MDLLYGVLDGLTECFGIAARDLLINRDMRGLAIENIEDIRQIINEIGGISEEEVRRLAQILENTIEYITWPERKMVSVDP